MNIKGSQKNSLITRYFAFLQRRKIGDRTLFQIALIAFFASLFYVLLTANSQYLTTVPGSEGTLVEGIVGTPRFVNPVLAITRADYDMVSLVYSGLMKLTDTGELVPDLAESVTISDDGQTYNITLRKDIQFHNGSQLTARDVAYTISLIQNSDLKSPLRGNWEGVLVEELGELELNIVLKEAYVPFMENLTVGILPRELWDALPTEQLPFSQLNTEPIGTGPYYVSDVLRSKSGLIKAYKLSAYSAYKNAPKIDTIVFNFYQNEDDLLEALDSKQIASTPSLSAKTLEKVSKKNYTIIENPLPRTFSIFFNQNKSTTLRDKSARKALDVAIDRTSLINETLSGRGIPIYSPVPPGFIEIESMSDEENISSTQESSIEKAKTILLKGGWTQTEAGTWEKEIDEETVTLSVAISTANTDFFDSVATYVQNAWQSLGVQVRVDQFEQTDLVQAIIRPRSFEALLFGNAVGQQLDLYPFWHSSQRDDPGLNIAQYTNIDADVLLERARTSEKEIRDISIRSFEKIIMEETPAIFLFTPTFSYVIDSNITTPPLSGISKPSDRFINISQWYMSDDSLWPVFTNN